MKAKQVALEKMAVRGGAWGHNVWVVVMVGVEWYLQSGTEAQTRSCWDGGRDGVDGGRPRIKCS